MIHNNPAQTSHNNRSRLAIALQLVITGSQQPTTESAESKRMREEPTDTSGTAIRQKNRLKDQMVHM